MRVIVVDGAGSMSQPQCNTVSSIGAVQVGVQGEVGDIAAWVEDARRWWSTTAPILEGLNGVGLAEVNVAVVEDAGASMAWRSSGAWPRRGRGVARPRRHDGAWRRGSTRRGVAPGRGDRGVPTV